MLHWPSQCSINCTTTYGCGAELLFFYATAASQPSVVMQQNMLLRSILLSTAGLRPAKHKWDVGCGLWVVGCRQKCTSFYFAASQPSVVMQQNTKLHFRCTTCSSRWNTCCIVEYYCTTTWRLWCSTHILLMTATFGCLCELKLAKHNESKLWRLWYAEMQHDLWCSMLHSSRWNVVHMPPKQNK